MSRGVRVPVTLILAGVCALAVVAGWTLTRVAVDRAEAHASLISSNPSNGEKVDRPPARVTLNFSEPIERKLTQIQVFDIDRNQVDEGDIEFDDANPASASVGIGDIKPGLYIVQFDNVSTVDGHPWNGVIQFILLNPDGTVPEGAEFDADAEAAGGGTTGLLPPNIDIVAKWIALLSMATVAGAAFWVLFVARPAASFLDDDPYRKAVDGALRWFTVLAHALVVTGFAGMAILVALTVSRFETSTGLVEYLMDIQAGRYRALFLALSIVALLGADFVYLSRNHRLRTFGIVLTLVASLVALVTFSLTSHGGVGAGSFWAVTSDYIHLVASAVWLGMLVMLVPFLRTARHDLGEEEGLLYTANAFDRFSLVAGLSVIAIVSTGVFNGLVQIPSWSAFVDTAYGRVLLVKLGLLLPLFAIAGLNAFVFKPSLVRAIDSLHQKGGRDLTPQQSEASENVIRVLRNRLPWSIAAEVTMVVAVFASVAVLSQTSTAKGELAAKRASEQGVTSFTDQKPAGDLQLDIEIKPNQVGLNEFNLLIRDQTGTPLENAEQVRLRFYYTDPSNPNLKTGQTELILNSFGQGQYRGSGAYFSQPGSWRVEAGIRRTGADDVSRNFVVSVAPAESKAEGNRGRYSLPFTALTWNEVVGALAAILGGVAVLYAGQLGGAFSVDKRWSITAGTAIFLIGAVLAFGVNTDKRGTGLAAKNPIKPTEESITAGRMLFQQNCIVCHGNTGRGDGPQAAGLDPAPTDFRLHMPLHTDPQFFAFIQNGYPGSAMPAWRDQLSDDEIWNLVNFMRSAFSEAPAARAGE